MIYTDKDRSFTLNVAIVRAWSVTYVTIHERSSERLSVGFKKALGGTYGFPKSENNQFQARLEII